MSLLNLAAEAAADPQAVNIPGILIQGAIGLVTVTAAGLVARKVKGPGDIRDEDALHVTQYKEQTEVAMKLLAETRQTAESAVKTQKELLELARGQVDSMTQTIAQLTATIDVLQNAQQANSAVIDNLQAELARNIEARAQQEAIIAQKERELAAKEAQLLEVTEDRERVRKLVEGR